MNFMVVRKVLQRCKSKYRAKVGSTILFAVVAAGGKLVLNPLLLTKFLPCFAGAMTFGEGVESFQPCPLPLPFCLAGGGVHFLLADGLELLLDGLVETVQKFLVVAPFGLSQSVLGSLPKAGRVFLAILQQHRELFPGVTFRSKQASERLRRLVVAIAHQLEYRLQGEGFGHAEITDWSIGRSLQ